MDIRMPELDGLEATRRILAADAAARVLILTTFDLDEYIFEALSAGASGFVLKDDPPEQLITAIRTVAGGDALLSPAVTNRVIRQFARLPHTPPPKAFDELTARERDVLPPPHAPASRTRRSGASCSSARRRSRPTSRASCRSSTSATASRRSCSRTRAGCSTPASEIRARVPGGPLR